MAGRSRDPDAEVRSERMAVRWTPSEMTRIKDAKSDLDLQYEVDVVRTLTLKQLDFEDELRSRGASLEMVREKLGLHSTEDVVWTLALRQLELISSALERDVAE